MDKNLIQQEPQRTLNPWPPAGVAAMDLAIVIPTRNEAANVDRLLDQIASVPIAGALEVLFVDDSDDGTSEVIAAITAPFQVSLIHREQGDRAGGLGTAVALGLGVTCAEWACVMDGDLQHPPMTVADLQRVAHERGVDVVIATRRGSAAGPSGLSIPRRLISKVFTLLARAVFPSELRGVDDPMSGFFLVRRGALDLDRLRPNGFKILLEILVTHPELKVAACPYEFQERSAGDSSASFREGLRYMSLLLALRLRSWRGIR